MIVKLDASREVEVDLSQCLITLSLIVIGSVSVQANAQEACKAYEQSGLTRTVDLDSESALSVVDINTLSSSNMASSDFSGAAESPLPVGKIVTKISGNFTKRKSRSAAIAQSQYYKMDSKKILDFHLVEGDPGLIKGYNDCLWINSGGLVHKIEKLTSNDLDYKLSLIWRSGDDGSRPRFVKLTGPILIKGAKINQNR